MYRPSSVKNKELMTLYEGDGEESFYQNEDSTSEVRLNQNRESSMLRRQTVVRIKANKA